MKKPNFQEIVAKFHEVFNSETVTINSLEAKIKRLEPQKDELRKNLEPVPDDMAELERVFSNFKEQLAVIDTDLNLAKDMLTACIRRRRAKMIDLIPELEEARNAEHQRIYGKIENQAEDLKKVRCQFLLACRDAGQMRSESSTVEQDFMACVRKTYGTGEGVPYKPTSRQGMPMFNLHGGYGELSDALCPQHGETIEALNLAKIPCFVQWYELTGELVTESVAGSLLMERKNRGVK